MRRCIEDFAEERGVSCAPPPIQRSLQANPALSRPSSQHEKLTDTWYTTYPLAMPVGPHAEIVCVLTSYLIPGVRAAADASEALTLLLEIQGCATEEQRTMMIRVHHMQSGRDVLVRDVLASTTVGELKHRADGGAEHLLVFAGRRLDNGYTVGQYNLQEGTVVHMVAHRMQASAAAIAPQVDPDVTQLLEMGFSIEVAVRALERYDTLHDALEALLSGEVTADQQAQVEQARSAAEARERERLAQEQQAERQAELEVMWAYAKAQANRSAWQKWLVHIPASCQPNPCALECARVWQTSGLRFTMESNTPTKPRTWGAGCEFRHAAWRRRVGHRRGHKGKLDPKGCVRYLLARLPSTRLRCTLPHNMLGAFTFGAQLHTRRGGFI